MFEEWEKFTNLYIRIFDKYLKLSCEIYLQLPVLILHINVDAVVLQIKMYHSILFYRLRLPRLYLIYLRKNKNIPTQFFFVIFNVFSQRLIVNKIVHFIFLSFAQFIFFEILHVYAMLSLH